jgi:basic amino acid/polyamine antiporter, APA family
MSILLLSLARPSSVPSGVDARGPGAISWGVATDRRRIGMFGATLVGLGGILGGGVLMLAGTAFALAGPAAILALALNGGVAWLTAMSVSEISSTFPESGGAYTFAKKVLSVRAAFAVGWVLWFAYIVAAVLYALGFAAFTVVLLRGVCDAFGASTSWLDGRNPLLLLATLATVGYSIGLVRTSSGGGQGVTVAKVVVFGLLLAAGLVALVRQPLADIGPELTPFFSGGIDGVIAAMGVTFISLQGFEMVAGVAGEIRDPQRTIPRAVFLSLGISLAIYLPYFFLLATSGIDGSHVTTLAASAPETLAAVAAREWIGEAGFWALVVAIVLATLSALQANLFTASRVAFAMAHDQTLPSVMERSHATRGTPVMAIYATALAVVAITFMVSDLAAAGAAASLIFLLAFALTHVTAYLARRRGGPALEDAYRTPMFPLVPVIGGAACALLVVFQALAVPDAGGVLVIWLGLGGLLYVALFKGRAEVADASAEALDPRLTRLRGKSPLVLLPIANPKNARSMVDVANALAPSEYARVLLLAIVRAPRDGSPLEQLADAQDAVRQALTASYTAGHAPEALITAAVDPWPEIRRIADEHACESLLLGLPRSLEATVEQQLEELINEVDCDVAMMRAPDDWRIGDVERVLVPVAGRGEEHELRARLLATLCRDRHREVVFLAVVPEEADPDAAQAAERSVQQLARMKLPMTAIAEVARGDDPAAVILRHARRADLLVLGLRRSRQGRKMLGTLTRRLATEAPCAVILLSRRAATMSELYRPIRGVVKDVATVLPWPRRDDDER